MPKCVAGSVTVPDVAARWASGETEPRRPDRLLRLVHASNRRRVRRGIGPVGQRKVPHDAPTRTVRAR
jgi:hypothetical protein